MINSSLFSSILIEYEKRKCQKNPHYFAVNYCKTLDIDCNPPEIKHFPDYRFLNKLFRQLNKGNDLHVEKSRQMLLSWATMIFFLHQVLLIENTQLLIISAKQVFADDGGKTSTPQSLLGKARFVYDHLPGFLSKDLEGEEVLTFKNMSIINKKNNSTIKAETSSPNAGRGGNYNMIFIDEAAYIPDSEAVFTACRLACKKGLIVCSTPNGKGNILWRLKYGTEESGFEYLRFHWSDHPLRSKEWYNQRKKSMTDEQVSKELEIKYTTIISGKIFEEFNYEQHVYSERLTYNSALPVHTSWDFGIGDPTAILFIQTDPNDYIYIIDEYQDSGKDTSFYAEKIVEIVNKWGLNKTDAKNLLIHSTHYGDPAGRQRGPRLESWIGDLYNRAGIIIKTKPGVSKIDKINRVKTLIRNNRILISPHCTGIIEAIQNYRRETDKFGRILSEKPVHDWASHYNDSLQEFVVNRFPLKTQNIELFRLEI